MKFIAHSKSPSLQANASSSELRLVSLVCAHACDPDQASVDAHGSWLCVRASGCDIWRAAFPGTRDRDVHRHADASAHVRKLHDDVHVNVVRKIETRGRQS